MRNLARSSQVFSGHHVHSVESPSSIALALAHRAKNIEFRTLDAFKHFVREYMLLNPPRRTIREVICPCHVRAPGPLFPRLTSVEFHIANASGNTVRIDNAMFSDLSECTRVHVKLVCQHAGSVIRFAPFDLLAELPSLREACVCAEWNAFVEPPHAALHQSPSLNLEEVALSVRHSAASLLHSLAVHLPHLRRLTVGGFTDSEIPAAVFSFAHLEKLVVSSYQVNSIPSEIGRLTKLTMLALHIYRGFEETDSILSIPVQVSRLTALESLTLMAPHGMLELPHDFVFCPSLRKVVIWGLCSALPESIGLAVGLTSLVLKGHFTATALLTQDNWPLGSFDQLPESLGNLRELGSLEISHTVAQSLPQTLPSSANWRASSFRKRASSFMKTTSRPCLPSTL